MHHVQTYVGLMFHYSLLISAHKFIPSEVVNRECCILIPHQVALPIVWSQYTSQLVCVCVCVCVCVLGGGGGGGGGKVGHGTFYNTFISAPKLVFPRYSQLVVCNDELDYWNELLTNHTILLRLLIKFACLWRLTLPSPE